MFVNIRWNELLRKVLEGTNMDFDLEQNYVVIRPARSVAVRDSVVKTNKIKGVVVDAHGEPLPGVTVVAKRGRDSRDRSGFRREW